MLPKRFPLMRLLYHAGVRRKKVDLRASFVALGVSNLEIRHFKTSAYLGNVFKNVLFTNKVYIPQTLQTKL